MKIFKLLFLDILFLRYLMVWQHLTKILQRKSSAFPVWKANILKVSIGLRLYITENPDLADHEEIVLSHFQEVLDYAEVKHFLKLIYIRNFSSEELLSIVNFYDSDAGKNSWKSTPLF